MRRQPREAYLVLRSGERVGCLLEKTGRRRWQATPVRDVSVDEVEQAFVDVVPRRSSVDFVLQGPW